ncbi:MAG: biotin-dependent carboxyltransferase family protein [Desulfosarcina sp.]
MTAALKVLAPGPSTTVQDRGRFDFQHMGVPMSGVADALAYRVANRLVGNPTGCAVLEATLVGPRVEALCPADIALTGARTALTVNGQSVRGWMSIRVGPGDVVDVGAADNGCRSYLAITGGIDTPPVMGSRSTYLGGRLGGLEGRPLKTGDVLHRGMGRLLDRPRRLPWHPLYAAKTCLRAIAGPQEAFFKASLDHFFASDFTVTAQANRMGYRLGGPAMSRDADAPASIISEPIMPGNVQVPADGQPIILLAEQTLGGYAKIATVISTDLFKVAQAKPGDIFHFIPVTLAQAHDIGRQWAAYLNQLDESL